MERQDVAYFVNSTPKYFYLLPLHFQLVRRYAPQLKWPLYIATEEPEHPIIQKVSNEFQVNVLPLKKEDRYFLESRLATVDLLPASIKYVFPIQEDFLLQYKPDLNTIKQALEIFDNDENVASIRLMPCPGPHSLSAAYKTSIFKILNEDFMFTYQATLWRRHSFSLYFSALLDIPETIFEGPKNMDENARKKWFQVDFNIAENAFGQKKFKEILGQNIHLAYPREHKYPNAVYLCPWPYRPTAVEKGKIGEWVFEFAQREGYPINR